MQDRFRSAVESGDAAAVRALLESSPDARALVNEPLFAFASPALVHVAGRGDVAMVSALLDHGADPDRRSDWWAGGFHALHSATPAVAERLLAAGAVADACAAAHLDRPDLLERLLSADPHRVHERGGDGQTPLHFARSRRIIDRLLDAGADADARDVDHRSTPAQWMLHGRRGAGRYELAAHLVGRGATPDLFLAIALGLIDRVRAMLEAEPALLGLRTTHGEYGEKPPSSYHIYMWTIGPNRSPLDVAVQFEQPAVLAVLQQFATPVDRFVSACTRGDGEEARALLRAHGDLVARLDRGGQRALPDAGWASHAAAVSLMLELGFDPFAAGQDGGTVLHTAAWQGARACVETVLRHPAAGALLSLRDPTHDSTPLDWCCHGSRYCRNPRGDYGGVARLLLEAGADPASIAQDASDAVRAVVESWRSSGA